MEVEQKDTNQGIFLIGGEILQCIDEFMLGCRSNNLAKGTISFYKKKLTPFIEFCAQQGASEIRDIDPKIIRKFFLHLEDQGNSAGGRHAYFRAIRAFLNWVEQEEIFDDFRNPIHKVKAPKKPNDLLDPVSEDTIRRLLNAAEGKYANRDRAIILMLCDMGLRASELCSLRLEDVDFISGRVIVRFGRGNKSRIGRIGNSTRKALRKYVGQRRTGPLFINDQNRPLAYGGLREIIRRLSKRAGVPAPSLHSFRRYFCLTLIQSGVDPFAVQLLMGHSSLAATQRYVKHSDRDLFAVHAKSSPVDNLL